MGCYLVKRDHVKKYIGIWAAEMCTEYFKDNKLQSIECKNVAFKPDGSFTDVHWHNQLEEKPKDDYKDSLSITVGTCTSLVD